MVSSEPSVYVTRAEPLRRYPQWWHWQRSSGRPANGDSSGGKCAGMVSNATRKSPQSAVRPSYSPRIVAGRSALDACIDGAPIEGDRHRSAAASGGQQQQADEPDRGRPEARGEQAGAGADGSDDETAEGQRRELGAVAGAVVGGEGAAAHRLRDALVDQGPQQHVLDAVRNAAEGEPDHRGPQDDGQRGARDPQPLGD